MLCNKTTRNFVGSLRIKKEGIPCVPRIPMGPRVLKKTHIIIVEL